MSLDYRDTGWPKTFDIYKNNDYYNGHLVYCTVDHLKSCVKHKVYKIEKSKKFHYNIKLEGIKTHLSYHHFDFLENNPALMRDFNIGLVLDTAEIMTEIPERKIDLSPNKEQTLTNFFVKRLGLEPGNTFDDLVSGIIKTNQKVWGIKQEDFDFLKQLSLQDIIKILQ